LKLLRFIAGGKQDILLSAGPTHPGLPVPGPMLLHPGDIPYMHRQPARDR